MKNIGILGDYAKTYGIISRLRLYDNDIDIFKITHSSLFRLSAADIIILNKYYEKINFRQLCPSAAVIINSDSFHKTTPSLITASRLITTGYSPQSTLTVSSVSLGDITTVLCCLQRSISSLSGKQLNEEEFIVEAPSEDISLLLTAIASALYLNIDKEKIKKIFI